MSSERYRQFTRQLAILQFLDDSRYGKTTQDVLDHLVEEMGITPPNPKTIERDIDFLQKFGYPIERISEGRPARKVWKLDSKFVQLPRQPISVVEMLAFAAGRHLLYPLAGTPYWEGIQTLWKKFQGALPEETWKRFEKSWAKLVVRSPALKDYSRKEGMLSTLNRAVAGSRVCRIGYRGIKEGKARTRTIEPHGIVLFGNAIYVLAADDGAADGPIKTFKLDRVSSVKMLDKRFKPRSDYDPEEMFSHSIGLYRSDKALNFKIRFKPRVTPWVLETPFHPNQEVVTQHKDGGVTIRVPAAHEGEVIPRLLSLGEHAEVISPQSSRTKFSEIARLLNDLYN